MTSNSVIERALRWYGQEQYAQKVMLSYLKVLAEDSGIRHERIRLTLEPSPYIDDNDLEKPRLFLRTIEHRPSVSIQIETENATPDEIRRLVPYLGSFPEPWERDMLADAGFDANIQTARDVAVPYEMDDTPIVLFVDSFLVGRLPWGLTYEEAVDAANERHARSLGGVL